MNKVCELLFVNNHRVRRRSEELRHSDRRGTSATGRGCGHAWMRRVLLSCIEYYNGAATHVALCMDTPISQTLKSVGAYVQS